MPARFRRAPSSKPIWRSSAAGRRASAWRSRWRTRRSRCCCLESGGMDFEAPTQALYEGTQDGVRYLTLDGSRLRFLGGSTNHWGGWTRPLDESDFTKRDWLPHSGWPFARKELEPYFPRAQSLVEAGPWLYDRLAHRVEAPLTLGKGGVYTSFFQFSQWHANPNHLPTHFGERYADDLKRIPNLQTMLHANVTGLRLTKEANVLDRLDVATLWRQPVHGEAAHHCPGDGGDGNSAADACVQRRDEHGRRKPERSGRALLRRSCHSARRGDAGAVRRRYRQVLSDDARRGRRAFPRHAGADRIVQGRAQPDRIA